MNMRLHSHAQAEYEAALEYYAVHALAFNTVKDLRNEIASALAEIAAHPFRFRAMVKDGPERRFGPTKKFRFLIYYRVEAQEILVLAISHPSRRPLYWAESKA